MTRLPLDEIFRRTDAEARSRNAELRAMVLRHPDLAQQLTQLPWAPTSPAQWGGFIPPRMALSRGQLRRNDSPQRAALVAICRTAVEREYGEEIARKWLEEINEDRWSGPWSPHNTIEGS